MSKWYEVVVQAYKTVVVEVEDDEDEDTVGLLACDEAFSFCDEVETVDIILLDDKQVESSKKHADEVVEL